MTIIGKVVVELVVVVAITITGDVVVVVVVVVTDGRSVVVGCTITGGIVVVVVGVVKPDEVPPAVATQTSPAPMANSNRREVGWVMGGSPRRSGR
jgi:hypothetical protein